MARPKTAAAALDPKFGEKFSAELFYMREMMQEFAQDHPKIARRLGIQAGEIGDPYVERLIEAFAWEAARSQLRIDAAFPELTQRLLEAVYPNFVRPTPSMSVIRLTPDFRRGDMVSSGVTVRRGLLFQSSVPPGERTACFFASSQEVMLYPLEITRAILTGTPPDIPALDKFLAREQVRGALRLSLRVTMEQLQVDDLDGLDRLPVYLSGDDGIASHLFELLHSSALGVVIGVPGHFEDAPVSIVPFDAVAHEAMDAGEGVMPACGAKLHGFNLVHEFFACPSRFLFFTLTGLQHGLASISGQEVEIVILLDRAPGALVHQVSASQFALFCTPVINLFAVEQELIELREGETLLQPNEKHPADYDVFALVSVNASATGNSGRLDFIARHVALIDDEGNGGRYYEARREVIAPIARGKRRYQTKAHYTPSLMFLSLLNEHHEPYEGMQYANVLLWLTNADLPVLLEGKGGMTPCESLPVSEAVMIRPVSRPWPPLAREDAAWKLVALLKMHASVFIMGNGANAAQALRSRLSLFVQPWDEAGRKMLDSIVEFRLKHVTCRMPEDAPGHYGHATGIWLTVDESGLGGLSPYLFGVVLERWLAQLVVESAFIRMELHSVQRGMIASWPARRGTRSSL